MCARTFYRHLHSCFDPLSLLIQRIIAKECPFGRTTKSSHVRIELAQTMLKMYFSIFYSKPSTFASQITRQSDNLQSPFDVSIDADQAFVTHNFQNSTRTCVKYFDPFLVVNALVSNDLFNLLEILTQLLFWFKLVYIST